MASDSDGEEDFVSFGTPLEPLEEDEPRRKPVPLHEQTVKDEKGRYQRFHGAFTGGFSAGYFNTVGTKEGWTPSTFVSSRQQKSGKQQNARPEDFMDEEDFGEHGIAPSHISRTEEFSSSRTDAVAAKARAVSAQASLIPGDTLLEDLITPARSSVGVELLRKMGWKEGQGVGPRVKRKAMKQKDAADGVGCGFLRPSPGSEESEDEEEEEFAPENVTFAPKDVTPVDFTPRLGVQGLGYRGLDPGLALLGRGGPEHIELFRPQAESRSLFRGPQRGNKRGGVAGQAFGVGALEDEDEDVYHRDSMSKYDTELGGEEPGDGLYGWTAPQQYTRKTDRSRDALYLGKILEGFTLAQKSAEDKAIFPPPALPRDYRPVHHFRPPVNVSILSGVSPALAQALKTSRGHMVSEEPQQGGRHQLDSGQRRTLLGEDVLQGPSSVMDLLRPEDRQRLLGLRNASNPPAAKTPEPERHPGLGRSAGPMSLVPAGGISGTGSASSSSSGLQEQQQKALTSWKGVQPSSQTFKPFESDASKQARYELYLNHLRQGDTAALDVSLDPGMTEWERSRERDEFVRASILYRPSSSFLSSRFTRAKTQEDEDTVEVQQQEEGDEDDKQTAVKMRMFGKLTRETFQWHPDKLLCKRFNVPDPHPGSGIVGVPKIKRDKYSVFNFLTVTESREPEAPPRPPESAKKSRWDVEEQNPVSELLSAARNQTEKPEEESSAPPPRPAAAPDSDNTPEETTADQQSSDKKTDEEEEQEEEEESRPPMDLFKAIFAASSDEKSSSSSSEGESEDEEVKVKEEEGKTDSQHLNLFNINASSSALTSSSSSSVAASSRPAAPVKKEVKREEEQEEFGPKLPPPSALFTRGGAVTAKEAKTKEKKHKKHSKHNKEKKKKKSKKHKHKDKEQKKSKKTSREEGVEEEEGVCTEELLKRLKEIRSRSSY